MKYEEFRKILKENELTLKEFAKLSNTSYSTCQKWGREDRPVSNWVKPFLDLYIKNIELQKEVDRHITFKQEFYEMMNGQTITVK
jgi:predicted transcriptional regulator